MDRICLIAMVLALLLSLLIVGQGTAASEERGRTMGYEDTLFDSTRVHTVDIVMDGWEDFLEAAQEEEYASCSVVIDDMYPHRQTAHDFADFDALSDYADAASVRTKELTAKIKAAENRMAEIAVLKTHIINYAKTRDVYTTYRKAGYSKKYYDAHESDILIHKAAKKAFDDLALKKLPTVKSLQAEYSDLLVQKKLDYAALAKAREEARQLQIYKANAEMLLRTDADEQRQAREHQQEK